jgi:hypothetical protein
MMVPNGNRLLSGQLRTTLDIIRRGDREAVGS